MVNVTRVIGVFSYLDDLLRAVETSRDANVRVHTVYSPTQRHEIQEALRLKPSRVRVFTLFGGLAGLIGGFGLAVFTVTQWNFITSGKPIIAPIPFVVVGFEMTILLGFLSTLAGMLLSNRMPRLRIPKAYDSRFSEDRFGLLIECAPERSGEATRWLRENGAEEVRELDE
jgi:molybdopterin-containing oxidoreductase family membrane subunit